MQLYIHKIKRILLVIVMCMITISFINYDKNHRLVEDIYTQTDRPFYFPGETIWFKSYVVDESHTITTLSDAMYAELISPKGTIVKRLKIAVNHGYAYGNFDTQYDWVGGIYTLKMYTNWMYNYGESSFFTKKITIQKIIKPEALLTLKFEREGYGKSSEVTANFEAKDLKNNPIANQEITYEVAVKGEKIFTDTTITDTNGKANPIFTLPKDLSTIDVVLTILLPHNGTTESISRSVPVVLDTIDLQFFPESGKLIAGTTNQVAFKAVNEFGKPVDISGNITDASGNVLANFTSYHDGMGGFDLPALSNTTYYAQIKAPFTSEQKIKLPKVHDQGVRFSTVVDSVNATLQLFSTLNTSLRLEISTPTKTLWSRTINKDQNTIQIPIHDFPIGITQFTIFDSKDAPVAERLVFLNTHKQLKVEVNTDKEIYQTREKVNINIKTTDAVGVPIPANLSIAVADNKLLSLADDKQDHILSYFLMSSELKGNIHKPVFYFDPKEPKASKALDYVMLTHGWRNYLSTQMITQENASYLPEREEVHKGVVVNAQGKPVKAHLLLFDENGNKVLVFDTNDKGEYAYKLGQSNSYILVAYTDNGKKVYINRTVLQKGYDVEKKSTTYINDDKDNSIVIERFEDIKPPLKKKIAKKAEIAALENIKPSLNKKKIAKKGKIAPLSLAESEAAALEEVIVAAYSTQQKIATNSSIVILKTEEIQPASSVSQMLQGRVTGVEITRANGNVGNTSQISIRGISSVSGNNQPLYVVDGIVANQTSLQQLDPDRIESITILKDASATALYGTRGANGVIVINSKNKGFINNWGKKTLNNPTFNNYTYQNIYKQRSLVNYTPKEFYAPVYDNTNISQERTDFRQTIYWNPIVQTDDKGEASLSFYNSDAITSFKVIAEGIGFNGLVGRTEKDYSTKKLLSIDVKTPNYMALRDTVLLPITIKNESNQSIQASINLVLPKGIELINPIEKGVDLAPKSSKKILVSVLPTVISEEKMITVSVKGASYQDIVKKEVALISPDFPTEVSISGATNQSYTFDVNAVVKNSLTANFTIYTDIVGDVMNGIESLIRRPYGCFEQTSSSTYPNILILQYLKETGKSNPEIEQKALQFIKEGYKRLIGFETKEGGFEWFGGTPPHETLTAYGVLEFTEMKEIYPEVDQKMIDRTVQWLMSRRDGKGGFEKSTKGYSHFTSTPKDVANAYIVYAISQAGINVDIEKEYNQAYNKALEDKDTYRMALLAATSYNFKQPNKAATLIKEITKNIKQYGYAELPVAHTITRSYGNSKNVETAAFTILALLKAKDQNEELLTKGIDYLLSQRKNGSFGSTQATATALKALINYTKVQKSKWIEENQAVELILNNKKLTQQLQLNDNGQIVIQNLENYIKEGKQKLSVRFTNPKITFPYEMHVEWDSPLPDTSKQCKLKLETTITKPSYRVGDNVRMTVMVKNTSKTGLSMPMAIIGIPSGTTPQPWQLKEILERKEVAYYEIFNNYIVFYWRGFGPNESKTISLDLKADISGVYQAPASCTYQYYADEYKHWIPGNTLTIKE
ncbi:TonB-dependent receptor plug domain-containing protein [Aquimarina algicola]|uniref:Alpha-2-macroglobulin domain-containing protein n=1 Tax=Aquimarina algicola TaxID=2589995 RepID=A0A504JJE0_9FLAO|nr:TonB-dependent receptor plug domain-containing protein [Aquimarina algicola]TPN88882.1 hypothetical protein FHK87_01315 [Aquimarina algicola]